MPQLVLKTKFITEEFEIVFSYVSILDESLWSRQL